MLATNQSQLDWQPNHTPVMSNQVLEALSVKPCGNYIDGTIGLGGHTKAILEATNNKCTVLGIDRDPQVLEIAKKRLRQFGDSVILAQGNYTDIQSICNEHNFLQPDGLLLDLGISSFQLEKDGRGFSFLRDEYLDMRMNQSDSISAYEIINQTPEKELADIIWKYGEERQSRKIAKAIINHRPISTTRELATLVENTTHYKKSSKQKIHPATLTFQAIRIAVNDELEQLKKVLNLVHSLLEARSGKLAVISFHSLEDRIVKNHIRDNSSLKPRERWSLEEDTHPLWLQINKKVIRPSPQEISINPRSRSARLRVAQAIAIEEDMK
ncbi:MAG: 16S rRNA (cytosine(1402)-N(4))-methyltransferase [Chloroflexi bacterium]|nr:16S rRNA (cytosine(1402)-N(4))-methyltransferase [Chloroflexota bacterium]|tara:strand:+ start:837 stop:1814 length:978 start_codon:yes stop_codon:yes gene_type:complete